MSDKVTLGGDRLGSGNKQQVELHGFERSTHDLGYTWRSTMAPGTLVPFMCEIALPGDTFDIDLDLMAKTLPTVGPLFGTFKIQADVFVVPMRLYHSALHNNMLGIGMNMSQIKLPKVQLLARRPTTSTKDLDNYQVNPSSIFSYLGIRGVGIPGQDSIQNPVFRKFNAIPWLGYWEIYKNYYSNKQEEEGVVIHNAITEPTNYITSFDLGTQVGLDKLPALTLPPVSLKTNDKIKITVNIPDMSSFNSDEILLISPGNEPLLLKDILVNPLTATSGTTWEGFVRNGYDGKLIFAWDYIQNWPEAPQPIRLERFPLSNIDEMRQAILTMNYNTEFITNNESYAPYNLATAVSMEGDGKDYGAISYTQEGLAVKTYQSDLFNNWLSTEWIDGVGGINEITAIDTSSGSFNIDTLNLSKKVYDMLNRIAVSGGSYDDWLNAVYDHKSYTRAESPVYIGGLIKELVFSEIVSNAAADAEGTQPLGTLAGKGVMADKHKGGKVVVKTDEPSVILGIVSLTPRLDYSQGNSWHVNLETLNDLHKPNLDGIGFQELITEQMAWWTTKKIQGTNVWEQKSAGKQPAWINYMTNVNQVRGNFAIPNNQMFMVLNRRYEWESVAGVEEYDISDLTTYIDPEKFNHIFAQTSLDSQNFWMQIKVDMIARRKMSAKVMPNL